ncbi:MAG: MurR/RpiR family transcriptional regulator [Firmicutes bacterium HGW-Firmicutes-1]|jgi:DNA-binding MurR/RpiR family transcriptional regulator|nr:MAG: MurR/RpiR family transcriptional regulator [Firmicutes bacterium HGW-Firmicutes-1]
MKKVNNVKNVEEDSVLVRIYRQMPYFNPALKRIGEYVLKHPNESKLLTTKELSTECQVAESTITRFVKELNYKSYRDFKFALVEILTSSDKNNKNDSSEQSYIYEDIMKTDTSEIIFEKVIQRNIQTLKETKERVNLSEIDKAVSLIKNADTIIFTCMGSSSIAAMEGVMRFTRAGKKCILISDESIQLMCSAISTERDVVIGISNSGRTKSVVNSLKVAKFNNTPTIAITSFEESPITNYADVSLFTSTKTSDEGSALYWEATTSKTAQILIVDLLYACYASEKFESTLEYLDKTYKALKDTR